jgi:hypothetical protein
VVAIGRLLVATDTLDGGGDGGRPDSKYLVVVGRPAKNWRVPCIRWL